MVALLIHWDQNAKWEEQLKNDLKVTVRCIPEGESEPGVCPFSGGQSWSGSGCKILLTFTREPFFPYSISRIKMEVIRSATEMQARAMALKKGESRLALFPPWVHCMGHLLWSI